MYPRPFFCHRPSLVLLFILLFLFAACNGGSSGGTETESLPRKAEINTDINNDEALLNERVAIVEEDQAVSLSPVPSARAALSASFTLFLRAAVSSPSIDGTLLHANHVTLEGKYAYVSYHVPEDTYLGGVEILDISSTRFPRLRSQALFRDTDATLARSFKGRMVIAGAVDSDADSDFTTPAILRVLKMKRKRFSGFFKAIDLPSFNANDMDIDGNTLYVTTGATGGGLTVFNQNYVVKQRLHVENAKAIARKGNDLIVMEGTGSKIHLFNKSTYALSRSFDLGNENTSAAKAEMEIDGDTLYLSTYRNGMQSINLSDGSRVSRTEMPNNGNCNGVTVNGTLAFIAGGKEGVIVSDLSRTPPLTLGRIQFPASTNFVLSRGNLLFVANGSDGFKILEIQQNNET